MKTDFNVSIHVDLGVTPEVVALVTAILNGKAPQAAPAREQREEQVQAPVAASKPVQVEEPEAGQATQPEQAPEAKQPEEAAPAKPAGYTLQDVRDAMDRTRRRIEGEDYKNDRESERYKTYHPQCSAQFKSIARTLGSDKPSTLPAEQRGAFIAQCAELEVLEDGIVGFKLPF